MKTVMQTKTKVIFLSLLAILFILSSCHKDDDNDVIVPPIENLGEGTAILKKASSETSYDTPNVYTIDFGNFYGEETNDFLLIFTNGTYDHVNDKYSASTSNVIIFDVNSDDTTKIAEGTYALDFSNLYNPSTFNAAFAYFNITYKASDGTFDGGDRFNDEVNGTLTISYDGDMAHIEYELGFADGEIVNGQYTGKIKSFTANNN